MPNNERNLLAFWEDSQATLRKAVTDQEIEKFERENSIALPYDFINYLRLANGFEQSQNHQDERGFNFWPLEELTRASDYDSGYWGFEGAEEFFIFCDYLDLSWAYALRVGDRKKGEVVLIGTSDGKPQHVAESFSKFIDLYLANDSILYVQ